MTLEDFFANWRSILDSKGEGKMKKYLVIDAGGTAVKYALMNESAKILERGKFPTRDMWIIRWKTFCRDWMLL